MRRWIGLVLLIGCSTDALPLDGGVDAPDAYMPPPPYAGELDLLLVVGDTRDILQWQGFLSDAIPSAIQRLVTGDAQTPGVTSLHVAVVTPDMGVGAARDVPGCNASGDDGLMQTAARIPIDGCASADASMFAATPNVFSFPGGTWDESTFAAAVACVASVGSDGCGFESHLEAMLKSIARDGHGADPLTNGAFLRPASVLAILVMSDEDDCSSADDTIYEVDDPITPGTPLTLRCHIHADRLQPISRYVDGLLALHDPSRIVFSAIEGMPPALAGHDPTEVLADPAMTESIDPGQPRGLLRACMTTRGSGALPGVRLAQLAQGLDAVHAHVLLESICDDASFETQLGALVTLTQRTMREAR